MTPVARVCRPDADTAALLDMLEGAPPLGALSIRDTREAMLAAAPIFYPDMPPIGEEPTSIGGVPVRIYRPIGTDLKQPLAALLFFHGGGWAMGDLDGYAPICARLASDAGLCVISVDYRLAPEHPFPAALDDAAGVAEALFAEGEALGIDTARIAVGGDSAGGNLAAVLCLQRRDAKVATFRFQMLLYPVTDLRMQSASYRDCAEGYMLTAGSMAWFRSLYLSADHDVEDWRVSPLLAASHANLPPAHVVTCGLDPLQDEGRAYADLLERGGIDVTRRHYAGQIHGFLFMGKMIKRVEPALAEISHRLQTALACTD